MSAGPLHKPTPLPQSQEAQAAWTVGWWQGKVIGFAWAWPLPCCLGGCDDAPHMR